jgi:polyhydroxyalkanoate synthase subunit PhaC
MWALEILAGRAALREYAESETAGPGGSAPTRRAQPSVGARSEAHNGRPESHGSESHKRVECPPASPTSPEDPSSRLAESLDRSLHYFISRFTFGISPIGLFEAYSDWLVHLSGSPGKQLQLWNEAISNAAKLAHYLSECACRDHRGAAPCIAPLPNDKRFAATEWQQFPFNVIHQSFLLNQHWWHTATTGVRGVSEHHARVMEFMMRQLLDIYSPSNYVATNPEILKRTQAEGGQNLIRGMRNFIEDAERSISGKKPAGLDGFLPGSNLAVTPGKVIYRNRLIELIQYEPSTRQVRPEPLLFIPAWIMKYYILDLSQTNSLVRFMRDQGFTVFMVSWKNPSAADRDMGFEEYLNLGVMNALGAIEKIVPGEKIHSAGYCLGGTLLTMAAAAMAHDGDERLKTVSLFAAQTDFTEAGELTLFTSESQVAFLEDMMWEQGYLDAGHMAGAFQMLRSIDMIWSRVIRDYLMGERQAAFDLMAWNADTTRMPYKMHSEYLRKLFLENELAEGRFTIEGRPVALSDIRQPLFVVGTETDHVSPWRSVFKLNLLADTDITFLLTSGGHNAGIVSEPGHAGRSYRVSTKSRTDNFVDPEAWKKLVPVQAGSWWLEWANWLVARSGSPQSAPRLGLAGSAALVPAPGAYVHQT